MLQALAWCSKIWSSVPGCVTQLVMVAESSGVTFFPMPEVPSECPLAFSKAAGDWLPWGFSAFPWS